MLLNPNYTFENFYVSDRNKFAFLVLEDLQKKTQSFSKSVCIYGEYGVGKTHLLHALANAYHQNGKNVLLTNCEDMVCEFVEHVKEATMDKFHNKYRMCDLLIIDDIERFSGKDGIQEELLYTIEALFNSNALIVFSSSKHPKILKGFEKQLKNYLLGGLIVDIPETNLDDRIGIIQKHSTFTPPLSQEIINYIATHTSNGYEIEGVLASLTAQVKLMNTVVTIDIVKHLLEK